MSTTLISWQLFFKALRTQKPGIRHAWLRYWMFSDEGAALRPKSKERSVETLSVEQRQKIATLFAATREHWRRTLH